MTKRSSLFSRLRALRPGAPQFEGFVHQRSIHHVAGWVRNRARPAARVAVEAVLIAPDGEHCLARGVADIYYGLLALQSEGDVRHGFELHFDPPLTAAERDAVIVRPAGAACPLEFAAPPEPPPGNATEPVLPALQGYIDELSLTGVSGWMMSPRDPASRLQFEVVLALPGETRIIARGTANQPYDSLEPSGAGATDYGFRIEFPEKLTQLERDSIVVRAAGQPDILARAPEFQGFVDELSTRHVAGWVRSRYRPEAQLEVEAVLTGPGGSRLAAGIAGRLHPGLALGAPEDGHHGFRLEFSQELTPEQLDAVSVRLAAADFTVPSALPARAATDSPEYQGYVDELSAHHAAGWVRIPVQPGMQLDVEAVLLSPEGEIRLAAGKAAEFHPGLAAGAPEDGDHGFHLRFAQPLTSRQLGAVLVRVAGSQFTLPHSFMVIAGAAPPQPAAATGPAAPAPDALAAAAPARRFLGFIDDLSPGHVAGWIIDVNDPGLRVDVEAVAVSDSQTRMMSSATADRLYPPLQASGFGDAKYGFAMTFPAPLTIEERDSLMIRPAGYAFSLPRAPGLQGGVDERSCHHVTGWARDRFHPEQTLTVEALLPDPSGGRVIARAPAGRFHPGLALAAPDSANHGFRIILATPLTEAERDALIIRPLGAETPLPLSENLVTGSDSLVQGFVDDYSATHIAGWMRDPQEPDVALEFEVALLLPGETRILATGIADQPYGPLAASGAGNPDHGFRAEFAALSPAERDQLIVRTRDTHIALAFGTPFEGFIDQRSTRHVAGWVRNRFRPEEQLAVEIIAPGPDGDVRLAEITAGTFNGGIFQNTPEDAHHGFRCVFETPLSREQRDRLAVRVVGAGYTLPLSPGLVTDFAPLADLGQPQDDGSSAFHAFAAAGYEFSVDAVTKFYNTLRVFGWFHHPTDRLVSVRIIGDAHYASIPSLGLDHDGVLATHGPGKGFSLQVLRQQEDFNEAAALEFTTANGWTGRANLKELCQARLQPRFYKTSLMLHHFLDTMDIDGARILDIGGRSRSRNDFSLLFKKADCVVFDIMPGENVDVVGDAHDMGSLFPAESFDAIYSVSTFEHLLMPWAVAVQMNHVLKPGGEALIFSHQTLGIHDPPWDFWRFSDTAWDALFNAKTGFEILDRAMSFEEHVLPFIWRPNKPHEERVVGFEGSAVHIRKTGRSAMSWNLTPADLTKTMYPS